MDKKKKPKFNVPNLGFFKSVKSRWRRPRGTHNKKRMKFRWAGASPRIGYRNPAALRGLHPSGMKEALVSSPAGLEGLSDVLVRIASSVGARKRALIEEKAKALRLRVLNPAEKAPAKVHGAGPVNVPKARKAAPAVPARKAEAQKAQPKPAAASASQKHSAPAKASVPGPKTTERRAQNPEPKK